MPAVDHQRLRRRRDELDLSNPALAARMDTNVRYVENIVAGTDKPGWRVIYKLSAALDLPIEEIVLEEGTPEKNSGQQPAKDPSGPPKRTDNEGSRTGPKREQGSERVA